MAAGMRGPVMGECRALVTALWVKARKKWPFKVIDDPIRCLVIVWPGGKDSFLWKLSEEDSE